MQLCNACCMMTFPMPFKTFNAFLGFEIMILVLTRMAVVLIVSVYHSFVNTASAFSTRFSDQGFYLNSQSPKALLLGSILVFTSYLPVETTSDDNSLLNMLSSFYSFPQAHFTHLLRSFTSSQFLPYCCQVSPLAKITSVKLIKFLQGLLVELLSSNLKNLSARLPVRSCSLREQSSVQNMPIHIQRYYPIL